MWNIVNLFMLVHGISFILSSLARLMAAETLIEAIEASGISAGGNYSRNFQREGIASGSRQKTPLRTRHSLPHPLCWGIARESFPDHTT